MVFQILLCKVGFLIFLLAFFILFILNILAIRNSHIIKQHVTAIENSFQRDLKPRLLFQGLFLTESDFGHSLTRRCFSYFVTNYSFHTGSTWELL